MNELPTWMKAGIWLIGTCVFVLISTSVSLLISVSQDISSLKTEIGRIEQIEQLLEREAILETKVEYIEQRLDELITPNAAAYAQLSSAVDQRGIGPKKIEMELRDAIQNVGFEPRRSTTDITIEVPGAYFTIAAPQINQPTNHIKTGSFDMWMRVNDRDVNNSNVRYSFPIALDATDVIVGQGVACYAKGDVINMMFSGTIADVGMVAIRPADEPLIPSIIFSIFRVGDC